MRMGLRLLPVPLPCVLRLWVCSCFSVLQAANFFVIDCSLNDPTVQHVALVFASTELASEFKSCIRSGTQGEQGDSGSWMTTLVGLHELHRSCFPHQVFGRQPPPGAGYKFRDRAVCPWHGRDQVRVCGFAVAEIRNSLAASFVLSPSRVGRAGTLASPSPFVGAAKAAGILATVLGFGGRRGRGLGIPWLFLGCQGCFFLHVASRFCQCCWVLLFFVASGCCRLVFVLLGFGFLGGLMPAVLSHALFGRYSFLAWVALSGSCLGFISTLVQTWLFLRSVI